MPVDIESPCLPTGLAEIRKSANLDRDSRIGWLGINRVGRDLNRHGGTTVTNSCADTARIETVDQRISWAITGNQFESLMFDKLMHPLASDIVFRARARSRGHQNIPRRDEIRFRKPRWA